MKVLGFSGSPIKNSNTDRVILEVLKATGLKYEFIKLADYKIEPCKACLGCVKTNECVIKDDGIKLAKKVKEADAIVIGGYTSYSSLDARTKAFIERLYPLRHNFGFMAGKVGAAVITSAVPEENKMLPPAAEMGVNSIMFYMMEEGMKFLGSVKVLGNVPCVSCGVEEDCEVSGLKMIHGPDATIDSVGIKSFEEQETAIKGARELGEKIAQALKSKVNREEYYV
jgi:multimeric flavodoxin WrbA